MGPAMIKCAEENIRVDPMAGARGLQHRCSFCTDLCVYGRVCRKGVACSHRSQTPARRTCHSIDMHQAEVTKKSATRALNFWACKEDVGSCQDESKHVETSAISARYVKKKKTVCIAHELGNTFSRRSFVVQQQQPNNLKTGMKSEGFSCFYEMENIKTVISSCLESVFHDDESLQVSFPF